MTLDHTIGQLQERTGGLGPSVAWAASRIQEEDHRSGLAEGSGDSGTLMLFRFDPNSQICGGVISRRERRGKLLLNLRKLRVRPQQESF